MRQPSRQCRSYFALMAILIMIGAVPVTFASDGSRSDRGLVAFYDFHSVDGDTIADRSGFGVPLDLKIENPAAVQADSSGLTIQGETIIRTTDTPRAVGKIARAIRRTGEITLEAWITSSDIKQSGPARIVTLSGNSTNRNFTLGQENDRFDVRFRTVNTNSNGLPSLATKSGSVAPKLTHVVFTRDRRGTTRLYINGKQNRSGKAAGRLSNWGVYRLALANEHGSGRLWRGTFHLVAIYNRAINAKEVASHFDAGARADQRAPQLVAQQIDPKQTHFEQHIAPLLANHCLECHDSARREGELDLSKRKAAFQGGESGAVIEVGSSEQSRLWEAVVTDEMPSDRPKLSDQEKAWLKHWLDDGAHWSLEQIDPAIYSHGEHASENWVRRLTRDEYVTTVKAVFGVDVKAEAMELLPAELRADGFTNTAYNLNVDLKHIEAYAKLANLIVKRMDVVTFSKRFRKGRRFTDKAMDEMIEKMGLWIFRGPIEPHELIAYRGISTTVASAGGDEEEIVGYLIEAMAQSPRFLYRMEQQRGDGQSYPVGDYELASRLSYTIWGSPPDQQLLKKAESGALYDEAELRSEIARLLDAPQAREHSLTFISEWLNLPRLTNLQPNRERFPDWKPELAQDMRKETLAFFEEVIWNQERPLSELLNAQVTFLTPRLAAHYGVPDTARVGKPNADALSKYQLEAIPGRGGLLTQGSVLTVGGDDASMVTRGLLVMHELLRGVVKDPPPCVDTNPVATEPGLTQRAIAEGRIDNTNCGGCHAKFEPLAFGLEKFDGIGGYHEIDEHGNRLRDDGRILFPGSAESVAYKSSHEMMTLMAESDRVKETISWKLTQFAVGRPLGSSDAATMEKIHNEAKRNGMSYRALMTAIATSDLVQMIRTEAE